MSYLARKSHIFTPLSSLIILSLNITIVFACNADPLPSWNEGEVKSHILHQKYLINLLLVD